MKYEKRDELLNSILMQIMSIIESRREQISTRSTVSLAASTAMIALIIQSYIEIIEFSNYKDYVVPEIILILALILGGISTITSLDLIKWISRNKIKGKKQVASRQNIFYFGWIAHYSESDLMKIMKKINSDDLATFQIRQVLSLSKNLEYRYDRLRKTYFFLVLSIMLYILSVISVFIIRYEVLSVIKTIIVSL